MNFTGHQVQECGSASDIEEDAKNPVAKTISINQMILSQTVKNQTNLKPIPTEVLL